MDKLIGLAVYSRVVVYQPQHSLEIETYLAMGQDRNVMGIGALYMSY